MGDDRPVRYEEDGKIIYRASGLMMCDRVFVALSENYTPQGNPEWFQEVLDEGSRMEDQIVAMYEERHDIEVGGRQLTEDWEVIDGVFIRCHIDGLLQPPDGSSALFEGKKLRESTWGKFKRSGVETLPNYPWQLSAYMYAFELEQAKFVGGLYDKAKDKITDIYVHTYDMPPIPQKAIIKRIAYLEALVNKGTRTGDVKCNVRMFPCPFFYLHDPDDTEVPPTRPMDSTVKLLIQEREEIKARTSELNKEAKELDERVKGINQGIEAWLKAANVDDDQVVKVGDWELKYHMVHRKGYEVQETDYTTVTVKKSKTKGE